MSDVVLTEELWARLEPLLPVRPRRFRYPERLPADDRAALQGILWVLHNNVPWRELPMSLFGVSGVKTGVPLAAILTGGNRHDVTQLIPLVEAIPPIRGRRGRPRRRPRYLLADRAYDHDTYRRQLTARGITPIIARRGTPQGFGLGRQRWPIERTIAWLHQFRRLRTRWERSADIHQAFLSLACSIICLRKLRGSF